MQFSERLKQIRAYTNFTQEEFAKEIGVSFATVNRLENGKTMPTYLTIKKIEKLCKERNISFEKSTLLEDISD